MRMGYFDVDKSRSAGAFSMSKFMYFDFLVS